MSNAKRHRIVVANDTRVTRHHGCDAVMGRLHQLAEAVGLEIAATIPLGRSWREPDYLSAVEGADLVVVNGEGSIHSDRERARQLLELGEYCAARGTPVALINSVYDRMPAAAAAQVRAFDLVSVREGASAGLLEMQGITAAIVPDLALGWFAEEATRLGLRWQGEAATINLLFTDSVLPEMSQRLFEFADATPTNRYVSLHTRLRPRASLARRATRWLTSRQVAGGRILGRGTAAICPRPADLMRVAAASRGVVTGRFHMVCLALSLGVPVVAFPSNTHKIQGMLTDAGLDRAICGFPTDATLAQTLAWNIDDFRRARAYVERALQRQRWLFDELRRLAERGTCRRQPVEPSAVRGCDGAP